MKTVHKLALAAGLPAVAIATFGHAASAAGAVPTTTPPGAAAIPADWQVLVDDTGLVTIAAPSDWTDLDTVPSTNEDGSPRPWVEASPNIEDFHASFETPGVVLTALPRSTDLQATLLESDVGSCAEQVVEPFAAGAFTGLVEHQDCGDGVEYYRLAVDSAENPAVTLLLQVGVTGAEAPGAADAIIASMGFVGGGVPASSTPATPTLAPIPTVPGATTPVTAPAVPAVPTTPAVPAVPTTVAVPAVPTTVAAPPQTLAPATIPGAPTTPGATTPGDVPTLPAVPGAPTTVAGAVPPTVAGAVPITDDTGRITVAVPPTWTEVITTSRDSTIPRIAASPNQVLFQPAEGETDTFSVPGVIYQAVDFQADTEAIAKNFDDGVNCVGGGLEPYTNGVFTGHVQVLTDCGGTTTRMHIIVASPADSSFTAVLLIQLVEPGDAELNTILDSFNYTPAG